MAKGSGKSARRNSTRRHQGAGWWWWLIVGILAVGVLYVGYRGSGTHNGTKNSFSGQKMVPLHEPKRPAHGFPWKYQAYALSSGKPAHLVRGSKITVVMLMASWCMYCAYVDRYVWPAVLHTPGLQLNIVDVSTNGGIGDPGPKQPPFTGHDNKMGTIGAGGMLDVMKTYVRQFQLTQPNVHVLVDPQGLSYWSVQTYPTLLFLNSKGQLVKRVNRAMTIPQAKSVIQQVLRQG